MLDYRRPEIPPWFPGDRSLDRVFTARVEWATEGLAAPEVFGVFSELFEGRPAWSGDGGAAFLLASRVVRLFGQRTGAASEMLELEARRSANATARPPSWRTSGVTTRPGTGRLRGRHTATTRRGPRRSARMGCGCRGARDARDGARGRGAARLRCIGSRQGPAPGLVSGAQRPTGCGRIATVRRVVLGPRLDPGRWRPTRGDRLGWAAATDPGGRDPRDRPRHDGCWRREPVRDAYRRGRSEYSARSPQLSRPSATG